MVRGGKERLSRGDTVDAHTYIVAASRPGALRSYTGKGKRMSMRFAVLLGPHAKSHGRSRELLYDWKKFTDAKLGWR